LKGLTYNDSIIVVDEAEDLSEEQIRLVGTRVGENSRIFFNGDFKQAVYKTTEENPLVKMCNALKNSPLAACIYLEEDVRSETSKLFANLFYD
jgi:PhoH-like ATPase